VHPAAADGVLGALRRLELVVQVVLHHRLPGRQEVVRERLRDEEARLAVDDLGLALGDMDGNPSGSTVSSQCGPAVIPGLGFCVSHHWWKSASDVIPATPLCATSWSRTRWSVKPARTLSSVTASESAQVDRYRLGRRPLDGDVVVRRIVGAGDREGERKGH
jgi:hypothetical protein